MLPRRRPAARRSPPPSIPTTGEKRRLAWLLAAALAAGPALGDEPARPATPCPDQLLGIWSTDLPAADLFELTLTIRRLGDDGWRAVIRRPGGAEETIETGRAGERIRFQSAAGSIGFDGVLTGDGSIGAFLADDAQLVHLRLPRGEDGDGPFWSATWTPLGVAGESFPFDLYVETEAPGETAGYLFFRDPRLPGLYGYGMRCAGDRLWLGEKNLGIALEGSLDSAEDLLALTVSGPSGSLPLVFNRLAADPMEAPTPPGADRAAYLEQPPAALGDAWLTATPSAVGIDAARIAELVDDVRAGRLPNTHGVLLARRGRLVVEEYFQGYRHDLRHDMRSASKTVASALIGAAIDRGRIPGVDTPVLPYFSRYRRLANWDPRKARITIADLLTMSSGLHADDSDPAAPASENAYQRQAAQPDWMRLALDAPMVAEPGSEARYGSANPLLLGGVLEAAVGEPVERFADRVLFAPLGITDYRWFLDPSGRVYLGGGMHLRPRDMAKLGQLYLQEGAWNGARVLSAGWSRRSTAAHVRLANVEGRNEYGYLWWRETYSVDGTEIRSFEARGNGGQYLFVVPQLELVAVVTSGNYRNRNLLRQPETILRRYLLPAAAGTAEPRPGHAAGGDQ